MSINETDNGNGQEDISPYQMFLMCIRSPKTIKEYSVKLETFFDLIVNKLGQMEFKTNDHSNGINDSYYKPSEENILQSYLKVTQYLTIDDTCKLEKQIFELNKKNRDKDLCYLFKITLLRSNCIFLYGF